MDGGLTWRAPCRVRDMTQHVAVWIDHKEARVFRIHARSRQSDERAHTLSKRFMTHRILQISGRHPSVSSQIPSRTMNPTSLPALTPRVVPAI